MSARELSELVLIDKEYENPLGTVRTHLYRLRKTYEFLSDEASIVTKSNGYRINPDLKILLDYEEFEKLCGTTTPFMSEQK